MTRRGVTLWRIACCTLSVCLAHCVGAAEGEVEPRKVLWQFLPAEVAEVFVARGGRCFYLAGGAKAKELSVSDAGVVAAGYRPALLDGHGRLWCVTADGKSVQGVACGAAVPAADAARGEVVTAAARAGTLFLTMMRVDDAVEASVAAYEDAAGRVWFGDTRGVQWFDGKEWRGKDLGDRNSLEVLMPMGAPEFAEDDAGLLYVWARWPTRTVCGTQGFWTFDGREWRQFSARDGLPEDRIEAICPLGGGRVLVNTAGGRLIEFNTHQADHAVEVDRLVGLLNDPKWSVREDATSALRQMGRAIELELKRHLAGAAEPEVRSRLRMVLAALKDAAPAEQRLPGGRYTCESVRIRPTGWRRRPAGPREWLAVATKVTDTKTQEKWDEAALRLTADSAARLPDWPAAAEGQRLWTLPDGRGGFWIGIPRCGLAHHDGRALTLVADEATRAYEQIAGQDALGRILLGSGTRAAAYWPGQADERAGLRSKSWLIGNYGAFAAGSGGRVWARLAGSKAPLSYCERGAWHDVEQVDGQEPSAIIPGREGALFVNMAGSGGKFHLFAGNRWYAADDAADLVRKHADLVKRCIDNAQVQRSSYFAFACDMQGRVWVLNRGRLLCWDGRALASPGNSGAQAAASGQVPLFAVYDGGRRVIESRLPGVGRVIDCSGRELSAVACPADCPGFALFERRLVDARGRFWHGNKAGGACVHTGAAVKKAPAAGVPVLCDSRGRVWLCEAGVGYNVVDAGSGALAAIRVPSADENTPLCERGAGEVWIACADGLRRYVEKGGRMEPAGVFRKGVPLAGANALEADSAGVLWLVTASPTGYLLTRIEPPGDGT